ncbi:hypothetical protein CN448_07120 [Bacillus cereus]|uniref:hypothetical protein n=1 Tax=Bacillus cereus TaxID=1396 RepID=UPI000BF4CD73|nr:hypothetical protein [Bacillus cereus]PEW72757.1 hypothetical protein CN448_07120 [Bacillus cereus]
MNKYQVVYNVLSPDGRHYKRECLEIYAPTVEHAKQGIENELKRRMGDLYQWQIDVQQIENEQLALL